MEGELIKTTCSILFLDSHDKVVFIPNSTILKIETHYWNDSIIGLEPTNEPILIASYEGKRVTIYPGEFEVLVDVSEAL